MPLTAAQLLRHASPAQRAAVAKQLATRQGTPAARGRARGMNATERAFRDYLAVLRAAGEISWFGYETVRLRLGNGAWFKPDFPTLRADGRLAFYETKGWWREAARLRMKVAASLYPHWVFIGVKRRGAEWEFEEFQA